MVLIIHAHPDPESFTAFLATAVAKSLGSSGVETHTTDLYRIIPADAAMPPAPFPPVLDNEELRRKTSFEPAVQQQMDLVERAEGYVIIHPDWWGGPPAVLKGWLDRVLRPGTAYERPEGFGKLEPDGLLTGRRAVLAVHGDGNDPGPLEDSGFIEYGDFAGSRRNSSIFPASTNAVGRKGRRSPAPCA